MAVFTSLTLEDLAPWLTQYDLGQAIELRGIASGIENSNFFLSTQHAGVRHEYVLTIFEKLSAAELPFYLDLTAHLNAAGVPCPGPEKGRDGRNFHLLKNKPAAIVRRLPGASHLRPSDAQRGEVAAMRYQAAHRHAALPRGPIHADLFRDNVLFEDHADGSSRLGGFIDYYFAGCDALLFDLAVCVNDWCIVHSGDHNGRKPGDLIDAEARVFLASYHRVRPLTDSEHAAWPVMLRAAALRFWLSRLYDFHLPRAGEMITPHDPGHFERILHLRRERSDPPWIS